MVIIYICIKANVDIKLLCNDWSIKYEIYSKTKMLNNTWKGENYSHTVVISSF